MAAMMEDKKDKDDKPKFLRAATISSATPLKYKDVPITAEKRERFEALDLETLLSEYRTVAQTRDATTDEDDEPSAGPAPEGMNEADWLEQAGLTRLTEKFQSGAAITRDDVKEETRGFTKEQVQAVKNRVDTLNRTLRGASRSTREIGDARSLFQTQQSADDDLGAPESMVDPKESERVQMLKEDAADHLMTQYHDLSEEDQLQVQSLCLIQITSLLEANGTSCLQTPNKAKKKKKKKTEDKLYCVSLESLVERDRKRHPEKMTHPDVPIFFTRMVDYLKQHALDEEGIFRKAGSAARIKTLRQKCEDAKGVVDLEKMGARPHDVSALLKQFLRDTPEPLLTNEYIEAFAATQGLEPGHRLVALQCLVVLLPPPNRACLEILLDFLALVASRHEVNKMSLMNLAVVFAPTLFYIPGQKGQQMLKEVELQVSTATVLKLLLEHPRDVWTVPPDIVAQLRFLNEANTGRKSSKRDVKDVKKLLADKDKTSARKSKETLASSITWVNNSTEKPPVKALINVTLVSGQQVTGIKVYETTIVREILQAVAESLPGVCLREQGGNIGSRRLQNSSRLLPVMAVNPGASFVVCI